MLYEEVTPEEYEMLEKGDALPRDIIPGFNEDILIALDGGDDSIDAWLDEDEDA